MMIGETNWHIDEMMEQKAARGTGHRLDPEQDELRADIIRDRRIDDRLTAAADEIDRQDGYAKEHLFKEGNVYE